MFRSFLLALQFLTIIPVKVRGAVTARHLGWSVAFYPLIGLWMGALLISGELLMGRFFHPSLVTAWVVIALALISGGLHLDGLADTFDGLAHRSDKEGKLRAMKDSTSGPFGVLAIVFALGLKYLALRSVSDLLPYTYYSALLFMPMLSRWAMAVSLYAGTPSRPEGLGRSYMDSVKLPHIILGAAIAFGAMTIPAIMKPDMAGPMAHAFNLTAMAVATLAALLLNRIWSSQFGGQSGDTAGATGEITELVFLHTVIIWSRLSIS